jgi:hypothetical protein
MSKFKSLIKAKLSNYPSLVKISNSYRRRIVYTFAVLSGRKSCSKNMITGQCITCRSPWEHFFGYYDKSPWCRSGRYILALEVKCASRSPKSNEEAAIGLIDTRDNYKFTVIGRTRTWNLQQGCMLQWLGPDFETRVIYNNIINGRYAAVVYNIKTAETAVLEKPIYTISRDGRRALSLNFSRLHRLRPGYGYLNLKDETAVEKTPSGEGIWIMDIENNHADLLLSLKDIARIKPDHSMASGHHWFNHLEFNPEGNRFSFIHRWNVGNKRYSRLFTSDLDGKNIYCLADDKLVSHCCWKNSRQLLSWARVGCEGDHYYLFTDLSKKHTIVGGANLDEDGHPSYSPDGRYILTDTYPDKSRMRRLIIYDTSTDRKYELGRYFAPFKYDFEYRCDLHPRWSRDGKMICFDSAHEGRRQMYIAANPLIKRS